MFDKIFSFRRLFCICLLLFVGCADSEENTATKTPDGRTKVTLMLNWFPEAEHGGYYAALVHGYYEEAGLDVEIIPGGPSAPVLQKVARGDVTFGITNADDVLLARAQDADLVAVMAPLLCLLLGYLLAADYLPPIYSVTAAVVE